MVKIKQTDLQCRFFLVAITAVALYSGKVSLIYRKVPTKRKEFSSASTEAHYWSKGDHYGYFIGAHDL